MKTTETLTQFLISVLPDATRGSYELLAGTTYPLNDYNSLLKALSNNDKAEKPDSARDAAKQEILQRLTPTDFPIVSAQSALEKFHMTLPYPALSRYSRPFLIPPASFEQPQLDISQTYFEIFGPVCGDRAYRAYLDAKAKDLNELQAFVFGMQVGRQCR